MRRRPFAWLSIMAAIIASGFGQQVTPTLAAESAASDVAALRTCLEGSDEAACIGTLSDPCQERPDGSTTMGIAACLQEEQEAWDVILNERYEDAMADARATDERLPEMGIDPDAAETLRAAQRAWIAYRDAECQRLYVANSEGTIRSVVYASCLNEMTARRAIDLRPQEM